MDPPRPSLKGRGNEDFSAMTLQRRKQGEREGQREELVRMNDKNDIEEKAGKEKLDGREVLESLGAHDGKAAEVTVEKSPGGKTIEDVIQREAKEEQDTSSPFSISKTLGGVIIARAVQKQIGLVLLISAFLIIYISNRYICQKKLVEIDRLEVKRVEARYKATVCSSILTEKSRESNVMQLLRSYGDSTLAIPQDPPYLIRVEE